MMGHCSDRGNRDAGVAASAVVRRHDGAHAPGADLLWHVLFPLLRRRCSPPSRRRASYHRVPPPELGDYLKLMGVFDVVFIAGGLSMFGTLVER